MLRFFLNRVLLSCIFLVASCKHEVIVEKPETGYPEEIENIIVSRCATTGCHIEQNASAVGGIVLETWDKLFEGGRGGAVVIPYRPDFSIFLYYINTDTTRGLALIPTMPYNAPPLSAQEYELFKDWIIQGAPDVNGFVKFSDNPERKKYYVGNQGCDEVTVFDAASMKAMRYIRVGSSQSIESPHMIKVSPDNSFWCVAYLGTEYFQKFSTFTNELSGQVNISIGSWKSFAFSSDSKKAFVIDWSYGRIAAVNTETMTAQLSGGLRYPNGCDLNASDDMLYVTSEIGNFIYKIPVNDLSAISYVSFDGSPIDSVFAYGAHSISFSPDGSKYFITCETTNEVRVLQTSNDSLLAVIPVGAFPQEMDFSISFPYLFVSCTEDEIAFPGKRGSVYVINYNDYSVVGTVYTGHQPQGIVVDDENGRVLVTNRNISVDGPPPHHGSQCAGKNGSVTAIGLNTLQLIGNFKAEVSVDPYCISVSH